MNLWMDIAIPALVFAAGCLAVAVWALFSRSTYIGTKTLQEEEEKRKVEEERNELREQVEQYGRDAIAQAKRVEAAQRERDEAIHMFNGLQTRFDTMRTEIEALKQPVEVTPKPKRTSRTKQAEKDG